MTTAPLKLVNLTSLYAHKPYKFLNILSTTTAVVPATTVATTIQPKSIIRLKCSATLWCRTIPCANPAHRKITSTYFRGQKSDSYTSDSTNKGQNGRFDNDSFDTQMRATLNGKADNQNYESNVSPLQNHREKTATKPSKLLTLPTILTIGRVAAVPLLVGTFYVESWWGPTTTTVIFLTAAFTDWLDGYLARKMNLGTPFGAFLDPVADKLMVAATLILLCTKPYEAGMFGQAPWILTLPSIAIIGREITMSAVREWAASQDRKLLEAVAVNNLGKWKTATQMSSLTILLAARDTSLVGTGTLVSSGIILLYISAWLAIWSLVVYMKKIWKVLLK